MGGAYYDSSPHSVPSAEFSFGGLMAGSKDSKYRWFAFVVYPDSAPANWWNVICDVHGQFCSSPLHSADSGMSKSHYHVIYRHPNTVRLDYVRRFLSERLGTIVSNGYVEPVVSPSAMMRYLLHMDDGDKEQFVGNPFDLCRCTGGFPLDFSRDYTTSDRREQRGRCFALIRENSITEYAELLDLLSDDGLYDLFDYACSHTILFTHYLASVRGRVKMAVAACDNGSYVK